MQEAMFYKKINKEVKCNLCHRRCRIKENQTGVCRVRKNIKGKLYSLVYGKVNSIAVDPIEKKPFFHFAPGSQCLSISTVGCNFRCSYCCNYVISQEWTGIEGKNLSPEEIVQIAKDNNAQGIAYTYTEPTIFYEYAYDIAKLAKRQGLYNVFVTNGYTTPEPIKKISKYLDAAVIDFKASGSKEFYREFSQVPDPEPIFTTLKEYKKNKVFIEITNLIAPDHREIQKDFKLFCRKIIEAVGAETPLHLIQFFPTYKIKTPPVFVNELENLYKLAKEQGIKYVYLGNIAGHKYESTFCPNCNSLLIQRFGPRVIKFNLKEGSCPECKNKIQIQGKKWSPFF